MVNDFKVSCDHAFVGFALWLQDDRVWAAGTYEYRAMGVAVISHTDLFRPGDFRRDRPRPAGAHFGGYFASIGQVNAWLKARRPVTASASRR